MAKLDSIAKVKVDGAEAGQQLESLQPKEKELKKGIRKTLCPFNPTLIQITLINK